VLRIVLLRMHDGNGARASDVARILAVLRLRREADLHEEAPEPRRHVWMTHDGAVEPIAGAHSIPRIEPDPGLKLRGLRGICELSGVALRDVVRNFGLLLIAGQQQDGHTALHRNAVERALLMRR